MSESTAAEIVEVYERSFREVFRYCAYRLFSKQLAEDAASAVFLRLVEQYPTLRSKDDQEIRKWLYGTASNVVARCLRDAKRRRTIVDTLARERQSRLSAGPNDDGHLDWPVLYEAMDKLNQRQQDVLVLRYFQGLNAPAIGAILGMKPVTVRVQLSRAAKRLKRELDTRFG